jgi:outer membrane protein assembly factor BamA
MTILHKYFILIIVSAISLYSQTITTIETEGNTVFSRNEIIRWSGLSVGVKADSTTLDSVKARIAKNLGERGYFNALFEGTELIPLDSVKHKLIIRVREGEPTIINKIFYSGEDRDSIPEIVQAFRFMEGGVFNRIELEENIARLLTLFENNGFPFARVEIVSLILKEDTLTNENLMDIHLRIERERKSRIDRVEIKGNITTKDYVIVRELRLNQGEEYSQRRVIELPKRLNRLRFFDPVQVPEFYFNNVEEGVLLISVKERETNNFDGIIGYVPSINDNETGYITGLVNVSLRNLFGTGRGLGIKWQQLNRYSQEMDLRYLEPWLLNYPFNMNLGYFQRKQDTTFIQRRYEAGVEYLATEDISAGVFINSEQVIPTEQLVPRFTVFSSNIFTSGVSLRIDTRDDPYAPTEGMLLTNSYSFSRKRIYGPEQYLTAGMETNINLQRISVSLTGFKEIFSRNVIAGGVHGRELRGSFFEESDLFRLGGTNTLRGFREAQFLGSRVLWTNLEYRVLLTRRTYTFLFFDTGYYMRREDERRRIPEMEGFNIGYGAGINLETGLGVMSVSYALGKGEAFKDGKIHFGLVNEF